ncbi:MAG: hypothetical protein KDA61_19580, partial [Planctomycetales bacterium]|nr:hypothetical protein [Planctomycetales bacterium]
IRANRLIDEDAGQIDQTLGGTFATQPFGPQPEFPSVEGWLGLGGETRYLGVRVDLNDAAHLGNNPGDASNFAQMFWYGWIGLRIDNEADATGAVTGWGYETELGVSIAAGELGPSMPGDFDADGDVDGSDFLILQQKLPEQLTAADYAAWQSAFGGAASSVATTNQVIAAAVPEPTSAMLAGWTGVLALACVWRRRRG